MATQQPQEHFENYMDRWEKNWQTGATFWDLGERHPELNRLVSDHSSELYKSGGAGGGSNFKRALVAGCGSGYDVFTLCEVPGIEKVTGLDMAPTAMKRAEQLAEQQGEPYRSISEFVVGNFFDYSPADGLYDLCFDYTFLCAMNPTDREQWAQSYARLIQPGGKLVTFIFPLKKQAGQELLGPPFLISFDLAKELLEKVGFECVYQGHPLKSPEQRVEYTAIWQKRAQ